MKRVVTAHDRDGKAVFASIGNVPHRVDVTAASWQQLWSTFPEDGLPGPAPLAEPSRDPRWTSLYPAAGQTRFSIVEFRPDEASGKAAQPLWNSAELALIERELPGVLSALEPDDFGMHKTDSVDYGIVLEGSIALELDEGAIVELEAGDVVVQNGTRHAWRPRAFTRMAFVMVGVDRKESSV